MTMTMTMMVGDEATETMTVETPPISAPVVRFISEGQSIWESRQRHWLKPEQMAHLATGHNADTGELTLAVGIRRRHNGLVRFDADLFRLDYNLSEDTIRRLHGFWHDLNRDDWLPKRVMRKLDCHFSKTVINFQVTVEQVEEWKDFLMTVLSNAASYIDIRSQHPRSNGGRALRENAAA